MSQMTAFSGRYAKGCVNYIIKYFTNSVIVSSSYCTNMVEDGGVDTRVYYKYTGEAQIPGHFFLPPTWPGNEVRSLPYDIH